MRNSILLTIVPIVFFLFPLIITILLITNSISLLIDIYIPFSLIYSIIFALSSFVGWFTNISKRRNKIKIVFIMMFFDFFSFVIISLLFIETLNVKSSLEPIWSLIEGFLFIIIIAIISDLHNVKETYNQLIKIVKEKYLY